MKICLQINDVFLLCLSVQITMKSFQPTCQASRWRCKENTVSGHKRHVPNQVCSYPALLGFVVNFFFGVATFIMCHGHQNTK